MFPGKTSPFTLNKEAELVLPGALKPPEVGARSCGLHFTGVMSVRATAEGKRPGGLPGAPDWHPGPKVQG